jgi:hypothetical protein
VVLHRHASGGNGRGPSDGDGDAVRSSITILPAVARQAYVTAQQIRPQLALRKWYPLVVMYGAPVQLQIAPAQSAAPPGWSWSPLSQPLPPAVHLLTLQRRSFLKAGGHTPDYPKTGPEGALRLQQVYDGSVGASCGAAMGLLRGESSVAPAEVSIDLQTLFKKGVLDIGPSGLSERTLSLARAAADVTRRSWHGVDMTSAVVTPGQWRYPSDLDNSSVVKLRPTQIRSFTFPLK